MLTPGGGWRLVQTWARYLSKCCEVLADSSIYTVAQSAHGVYMEVTGGN
jgi:hypothetical protein